MLWAEWAHGSASSLLSTGADIHGRDCKSGMRTKVNTHLVTKDIIMKPFRNHYSRKGFFMSLSVEKHTFGSTVFREEKKYLAFKM